MPLNFPATQQGKCMSVEVIAHRPRQASRRIFPRRTSEALPWLIRHRAFSLHVGQHKPLRSDRLPIRKGFIVGRHSEWGRTMPPLTVTV